MQAIIKRNDPLYRQIVSYFEEEILQGRLKPGDRIPATTRLSEIFNVNPDTVQQSLKLLAERGFVSRAPGRGTFVRKGINSRTFGIIFKRTVLTDEDVSFYSGFLNDFILLAEQEQWNCRLFMVTENLSPEDASGEKGLLDLKKAIADGKSARWSNSAPTPRCGTICGRSARFRSRSATSPWTILPLSTRG